MSWIIESTEGVFYDRMSNNLKDSKGYEIATIFEEEDGGLYISLAMPTNFIYEDGTVAVGWNGDDIHGATVIRREIEGGTLKYCENRFSDEYYQGIRFGEISIRITKVVGQIVPRKTIRIKRKNIFQRFFDTIWKIPVFAKEC